jgi:hypothetical protein
VADDAASVASRLSLAPEPGFPKFELRTAMFTEERALWIHRHLRWLEENLPAREDQTPRKLILPTPEFFPMRNTRDHTFALAVFDATRAFMGVTAWPCRLTPQSDEERAKQARLRNYGVFGESQHSGAAGTFRSGKQVEITYSPSLLRDPVGLVAVLAHELCHYLLATVEIEPPCGWGDHEPLTDLAAIVEGFGVFLCNSAFSFGQWSDGQYQGWQSERRGYLNEAELGFALGVFCVRQDIPPDRVARFLKPNPREVFVDSIDYVVDLETSG